MWSFNRSVIVAPKKSALAPSISASAAAAAATAASVSSGTPMDSVAVVSSGDAAQSTPAEAAAGEDTRLGVTLAPGWTCPQNAALFRTQCLQNY